MQDAMFVWGWSIVGFFVPLFVAAFSPRQLTCPMPMRVVFAIACGLIAASFCK